MTASTGNASNDLAQLAAVTRRAFTKKLVVQLYNTSPTMAALLMKQPKAKVKADPMPKGVEPLYLTEENKELVRQLIRKITPNFEPELWAKVKIEDAKAEAEKEALRAQMRQFANAAQQSANIAANQMAQAVYAGTTGAVFQPNPFARSLGGTTTPVYTTAGTGFNSYGPLLPDQGLTLVK